MQELIYSVYSSLTRYTICKFFSHFVGCLFTILMVYFEARRYLFDDVRFISFFFNSCTFSVIWRTQLSNPRSWRFTYFKSFVLPLILRARCTLEFIFVNDVRKELKVIFRLWISSCPSTFRWKDILSLLNCLGICVENQLTATMRFIPGPSVQFHCFCSTDPYICSWAGRQGLDD